VTFITTKASITVRSRRRRPLLISNRPIPIPPPHYPLYLISISALPHSLSQLFEWHLVPEPYIGPCQDLLHAKMAPTHNNPHRIFESPEGERSALNRDYDDDTFSSSSQESNASLRKPLSSFCTDDDEDLEDGIVTRPAKVRSSWWSFKNIMTVRERRKASLEAEGYKGLDDAPRLLADVHAVRQTRRKRNWYNYCIFGGISGLSILLVFFLSPFAHLLTLSVHFFSSSTFF
jgi:hypothetical protein